MTPQDPVRKIAVLALGMLIVGAALERLGRGAVPQGTFLTLFEVAMGLIATTFALRSRTSPKVAIGLSAALIAIADGTFFLWNYVLKVNVTQESGSILAVLLYGAGCLSAAIVFWSFARSARALEPRRFLIPATTILCIMVMYFLPLLIEARSDDTTPALVISQGLTLIAATICATLGLTALTHAISPFLVHYGICFTMLPILIITLAAEIYKKGPLSFGLYEYLWAFGSFWGYASIIHLLRDPEAGGKHAVAWLNRTSITVHYKTTLITGVALILLTLTLVAPETPIQWVSFGIIASIFLSVLISAHLTDSISQHSLILGRVLEQGFSSGKSAVNTHLKDLPVELEDIFSSVFAENLEKKRIEQENQTRNLELQRRFAHDIRTPIKALENVLREDRMSDAEIRRTSTEAVRSMMAASERILADLRQPEDRNGVTPSSSTATDIEKAVMRCIRIMEASLPVERKLPIRWQAAGGPFHAWIDESAFERALLNLLKNATESPGCTQIDITLAGSPVMEIAASTDIQLVVADNGQGASPDIIEKLNQGRGVTTKSDGHGLGTSGSMELVQAMGGSLHFESQAKKFFKAILNIPRASDTLMLIDDDRAIHLAWKALARKRSIRLIALFPGPDLLSQVQSQATRQTEIHVDYNLKDEFGNTILKSLKEKGYTRLHLVTSSDSHELPESVVQEAKLLGWSIRDKTFPRA